MNITSLELEGLSSLLDDPTRLQELTPEDQIALLACIEKARVYLRANRVPLVAPSPAPVAPGGDRLLKVEAAAAVLAVSPNWLYEHAADLPFTRKLTTGALRFSERGLQDYLERLA